MSFNINHSKKTDKPILSFKSKLIMINYFIVGLIICSNLNANNKTYACLENEQNTLTNIEEINSTEPNTYNNQAIAYNTTDSSIIVPQFSGNFNEFFTNNFKYPLELQNHVINGRIVCQFNINEDGSISDIEVIRSVHPALDREVVRVIEMMPNWIPACKENNNVKYKYTLPINFKFDNQYGL